MHEDGRRTLIETILYFEHATRELPLDVILGIAIGGSVLFAFAPDNRRVERTSELTANIRVGVADGYHPRSHYPHYALWLIQL